MIRTRSTLLVIAALLLIVWHIYALPIVYGDYLLEVYPLSISADGNYITVGDENRVYVFNPPENEPAWAIVIWSPLSLSMSSDGSYVAVGTDSGAYLFAKGETSPRLTVKPPHPYWFYRVFLSSDANYLVVGTREGAYMYARDNGALVWSYSLDNYHDYISAVSLSADGGYIAVAAEGDVHLFRKDDNTPIRSYTIFFPKSVSLSADGGYTAVGAESSVYLLTENDNNPIWSYPLDGVLSVSLSADGDYLAVGNKNGVYVFDLKENVILWTYSTKNAIVSISADGNRIAAAATDLWAKKVTDVYLFTRTSNEPIWSHSFEKPPYQEYVVITLLIAVTLAVVIGTILVKRRLGLKHVRRHGK